MKQGWQWFSKRWREVLGQYRAAFLVLCAGVVLLLIALLPLGRDAAWSRTEIASAWAPDETELKQAALQLQKAVIEREYAAYIEDKAAERGLECTAQVTCRETDGLLPPRAAV